MVTLASTWSTSLNNVPTQTTQLAQSQGFWYNLKNFLVATVGWTVQASSDSTVAGAADHWSGTGSLIWAGGAGAHSWIILESPTGMIGTSSNRIRMLISCNSANNYQIVMSFASADFTSVTSTTVDPTAPTNHTTYAATQFTVTTGVVNCHYHYEAVTGGSEVGNFLFQISQDGTGLLQYNLMCIASHGYQSADTWPVLYSQSYNATTPGALSVAQLISTSRTESVWIDATIVATAGFFMQPFTNSTNHLANFTSTGDTISGNFPDYPLVHVSVGSSHISMRGYFVDLAWSNGSGTSVNQGTVEPATGTTTTTIMGDWWVPNGGTTPSL